MTKIEEKLKNISKKIGDPTLIKVIVNMGIGGLSKNEAAIESLRKDMAIITGQNPSIRRAKVSIASFSLREGQPVGLAVTLRKQKMFAFLDRLFSIVLPRLRDFRGISDTSFDKMGNYTLGLTEHTIFPEIDTSKGMQPHGMEITIVTTSGSPEKAKELLTKLGCPFKKGETN